MTIFKLSLAAFAALLVGAWAERATAARPAAAAAPPIAERADSAAR